VVTLSPLTKHTETFSTATATVVTNSELAYRAANQLHQDREVAAAIDNYDTPGWRPDTATTPLLTPEQIAARTKILEGLKAYAQALADLTETKNRNQAFDTALTTAGANLQSLNAAAAPPLKTLFPSLSVPSVSAAEAGGVTTAIDAIAKLLLNGRAKQGLAKATADMDPSVQALCKLILRRQADRDYQTPITNENQFIQNNPRMDPALRRVEIAKLITLAAQQKENDAMLASLQDAVQALGRTHAALAEAASGKDPENLKQRLNDLIQFGTDLGAFYGSTQ
jgi:hypothetical protein